MAASAEPKMTVAERAELGKLVRLRARNAARDAVARGAMLRADVEQKLSAIFERDDARWAAAVASAEKAVEAANARIGACFRDQGIPESFWPKMGTYFLERGENASARRRPELRKAAETRIAAMVERAKVEIDRDAERQLTQLPEGGLSSTEARAFLNNMPSSEQLLPAIGSLELKSGEIVALEETVTLDESPNALVTVERNVVTDKCNGVTTESVKCNACGVCEKSLAAGRGLYCTNACR